MSLKIIGSVIGVTGVAGGAAYVALKHPNILSSLSLKSSSPEVENCMPIEETAEHALQGSDIEKEKYVAISCTNTDSASTAKKLSSKWMGWFPKSLLKLSSNDLELKGNFALETDTQSLKDRTNEYQTTFKGDKFLKSSVSGIWKVEEDEATEKPITFTISGENSSQEKIYLLFIEDGERETQ